MTELPDTEIADGLRALGATVKLTKKGRLHTVDLRPLADQAGNAEIAQLAGLERLQELYLAGTAVDDAGVIGLGDLPKLATFDLQATGVGDASLEYLKSLAGLKLLLLNGTHVTREGVGALRKEMIGTRIVFG